MNDSYKPIAKYYDLLSRWYSLGMISSCREAYLEEIVEAVSNNNELRVCFVGVGHGSEAIKVAKGGALVTVVDNSLSMLEVFNQNISRESAELRSRVEVIHADLREFSRLLKCPYDWVIANFFLNVFEKDEMRLVFEDICICCRKEGVLVISDFYLARGDTAESPIWLIRSLQIFYWYTALIIF